MDYENLKEAARVFNRINTVRNYVSKERFDKVAKIKFGIDDERKLDAMYGLLNLTQQLVYYIANDSEEFRETNRCPEYMELIPKAIEIAECAYEMMSNSHNSTIVPSFEFNQYRREDKRRYFYTDKGESKVLDISLDSRTDIVLLGDVLQNENIKLIGVAEHLGYLEGERRSNNTREKFQYFEGDIYFLYRNPTDRVFYDWFSNGDDTGVYIATEKGWRKLLYTPGRGYIDRDEDVEYIDDEHYYSDYKLEASGKKFHYVGNIHHDISVLVDGRRKEDSND